MATSQKTRFGPLRTPQTSELLRPEGDGSCRAPEYDDGSSFFARFRGALTAADLRDQAVLDVGCGYGGRTVYYATGCAAPARWTGSRSARRWYGAAAFGGGVRLRERSVPTQFRGSDVVRG